MSKELLIMEFRFDAMLFLTYVTKNLIVAISNAHPGPTDPRTAGFPTLFAQYEIIAGQRYHISRAGACIKLAKIHYAKNFVNIICICYCFCWQML